MNSLQPNLDRCHRLGLRPPSRVMRLKHLGAMHQCPLSFMRSMLRRLHRHQAQVKRSLWRIDERGVGTAVYQCTIGDEAVSLVVFAHDLPDALRSDRVIATAWDVTFTLHRGAVSEDDIARLSENVPLQEAGRVSHKEITLSRANRSVRVFDRVVECLSRGIQPPDDLLLSTGYLMRTTAVYGSGKFGAADFGRTKMMALFNAPFRAEMLSVWLIKQFTIDIVNHLAAAKNPDGAVALSRDKSRLLGIGNSTGLGMAPFLMNHPRLLHQWIYTREQAFFHCRAKKKISASDGVIILNAICSTQKALKTYAIAHQYQAEKNTALLADIELFLSHCQALDWAAENCLNSLYLWVENNTCAEMQELFISSIMEPFIDEIDPLADALSSDEEWQFFIDGGLKLQKILDIYHEYFSWVEDIDFSTKDAHARFWYVSQEKLEPRLGERFEESGADKELPLNIATQIYHAMQDIKKQPPKIMLHDFLNQFPQHRFAIRRMLMAPDYPYGEIQGNLTDSTMMAVDLLRAKLSFFGATNFDPKSDRWMRITMFQYAPLIDELHAHSPYWVYDK